MSCWRILNGLMGSHDLGVQPGQDVTPESPHARGADVTSGPTPSADTVDLWLSASARFASRTPSSSASGWCRASHWCARTALALEKGSIA